MRWLTQRTVPDIRYDVPTSRHRGAHADCRAACLLAVLLPAVITRSG
jgi:hypothetical protein